MSSFDISSQVRVKEESSNDPIMAINFREEHVLDNDIVMNIKQELLIEELKYEGDEADGLYLKQETINDGYEYDDIDLKEERETKLRDIKFEISEDETEDFICSPFTKEDVESAAAEVDFIKREINIIKQEDNDKYTVGLDHNYCLDKVGKSGLKKHEHVQLCQSQMEAHLEAPVTKIHSKVTYNCELCDYKATQKGNLKRHVQSVHDVVKSVHKGAEHNCELCDYKATQKSDLKRHNCELCDYKATQKSDLKRHVQS